MYILKYEFYRGYGCKCVFFKIIYINTNLYECLDASILFISYRGEYALLLDQDTSVGVHGVVFKFIRCTHIKN